MKLLSCSSQLTEFNTSFSIISLKICDKITRSIISLTALPLHYLPVSALSISAIFTGNLFPVLSFLNKRKHYLHKLVSSSIPLFAPVSFFYLPVSLILHVL